jgi:acetoacetate decarboxylase
MPIKLDQITNMPAFSPYYPMPPARYRNARFQFVFFCADVSSIDRVLPECFEPREDGLCVAIGLSVPWAANYGAFEESILSVPCTYKGEPGYFAPVVFLNSKSSIPAGREIYGTPKVYADVTVAMDERVMYTDTVIANSSLLSIRTTMHREATPEEIPTTEPNWRLKVIPRADGTGPDVMQIIGSDNITSDKQIHVCRAGDGVVQFNPSPIYDLSDFEPISYHGAYYVETDFTEGYGTVLHDFLKE